MSRFNYRVLFTPVVARLRFLSSVPTLPLQQVGNAAFSRGQLSNGSSKGPSSCTALTLLTRCDPGKVDRRSGEPVFLTVFVLEFLLLMLDVEDQPRQDRCRYAPTDYPQPYWSHISLGVEGKCSMLLSFPDSTCIGLAALPACIVGRARLSSLHCATDRISFESGRPTKEVACIL